MKYKQNHFKRYIMLNMAEIANWTNNVNITLIWNHYFCLVLLELYIRMIFHTESLFLKSIRPTTQLKRQVGPSHVYIVQTVVLSNTIV